MVIRSHFTLVSHKKVHSDLCFFYTLRLKYKSGVVHLNIFILILQIQIVHKSFFALLSVVSE